MGAWAAGPTEELQIQYPTDLLAGGRATNAGVLLRLAVGSPVAAHGLQKTTYLMGEARCHGIPERRFPGQPARSAAGGAAKPMAVCGWLPGRPREFVWIMGRHFIVIARGSSEEGG